MDPILDGMRKDSIITQIQSLAPYFSYDQERPRAVDAQKGGSPAQSETRNEWVNWNARRNAYVSFYYTNARLLRESNDQVVVNRENQRVTPQIGAANVGQILAGSTTKGQLVSHDSYSHPVRDTCISSSSSVIMEWGSARMKEDMVRIISQWLADEGFGATRLALLEEAGVKLRELDDTMAEHRKLCNYLLEGNWTEVDKLCTKPFLKDHKALLYAVYKQQYLEHIEHREYQKAFTFLTKRLKPLEHYQPHAAEFGDLCYLLSAQSVTDAPSFRSWEGIQPAREALIAEFSPILQQDQLERDAVTTTESTFVHPPEIGSGDMDKRYVPPHRLVSLLHQALAYQVEFARYQKRTVPVVSSLLQDYAGFVVPNRCRKSLYGHSQNVKCVRFVGDDGHHIVSGSGDWAVRVWDTATGACDAVLEGHGSRIWDVDATHDGTHVASASGDSTIKIWNVESKLLQRTLQGGYGDVYTCRFSPDQTHLVSGGYDKLLRLYDISTGTAVRMMPGHDLGISSTVFNPQGNLIVSGAKDTTIRLWDKLSGLSVHTLQGHLGEITSVDMSEDGMQLLTSSKDNSGRLWDMRMLRPLQRFKGNQNTSKNFIRASFLDPSLIASGSEDGLVYLWEKESPNVLQTLEGHGFEAMYTDGAADVPLSPEGAIATGSLPSSHAYYTRKQVVVYSAVWNKVQGILASCADDGTVRLWDWARPPDDDLIAP